MGDILVNGGAPAIGTWYKTEGLVTAPASAAYAQIQFYCGNADQWANLDDWEFKKATTGSLIVAGAIDGKVITGATVQTAASGARVVMSGGAVDSVQYFNPDGGVGVIHALGSGGSQPSLTFLSPTNGTYSGTGVLSLYGGNPTPLLSMGGDINLSGQLVATGALFSGAVYSVTTGVGANVVVDSGGRLLRSTSVRAAKTDIAEMSTDDVRSLLDVPVITFLDEYQIQENDGSKSGLRRIPGVLAEDVEKSAPTFAIYDTEGLTGVAYDRIGVAWIPLVKELYREIELLKEKLNA
jgi:hypothetical protein